MERLRHHLIPPLLLLGLLAGAAVTIGADAQPCESTHLATQIARSCTSGLLPTAPCCEPVVASVDRGGGVPCLCRVAAQPQVSLINLKASHLVSLYIGCGGADSAHLAAAACLGSPPLATPIIAPPPAVALLEQRSGAPPSKVPVITPPEVVPPCGSPPLVVPVIPVRLAVPLHKLQTGSRCNSTLFATELTRYCRYDMKVSTPGCCRSVLMTIDDQDRDCLCRVTEAGRIVTSDYLNVKVLWDLYKQCGGRQEAIPKDRNNCAHTPSPPPPPPPPQLAPPPPARQQPPSWVVPVIVVVSVLVGGGILIGAAKLIKKKIKSARAARQARQQEHARGIELQRPHRPYKALPQPEKVKVRSARFDGSVASDPLRNMAAIGLEIVGDV